MVWAPFLFPFCLSFSPPKNPTAQISSDYRKDQQEHFRSTPPTAPREHTWLCGTANQMHAAEHGVNLQWDVGAVSAQGQRAKTAKATPTQAQLDPSTLGACDTRRGGAKTPLEGGKPQTLSHLCRVEWVSTSMLLSKDPGGGLVRYFTGHSKKNLS